MLLIIDNQSTFIKQFRNNWLEDHDIPYRVFDHNQPLWLDQPETVQGIILSGGKGNPYEPLNLTTNFVALMNYDVPIIGFCLGHEILAVAHGGRVRRLEEYQNHRENVTISDLSDPIFNGITEKEILLREKHWFHVHKLPDSFIALGSSKVCPYEIVRHRDKPIYGFQAHPEVSGTQGMKIMANFIKMCKIEVT